jgi:MoaA/NifB/PqqE/SkfB family radical SAM enzyme
MPPILIVMVVMMMVVMMTMPRDDPNMMVVMMMMPDPDGDLGNFGRRLRKPRIVGLEHRHRIRNWIKQIPVTRNRCRRCRLRGRRLGAGHRSKCCGRSQQAGDLLIHISSNGK